MGRPNYITLHGQLFHERQYAVLNMSGPSHSANSNLTYADSCNDRELGFVCIDLHGKIPSGKFLLLNIRYLYTIYRCFHRVCIFSIVFKQENKLAV